MPQHEHQSRGAIVDHGSRLRAAREREIVFEISGPAAAFPGMCIVFEIVIIRADLCEGRHGRFGQRGAPEVRVQEHAGAVDDATNPLGG